MILKQFYLPCLAHASYVIGDEKSATAVVVDPQRDTDQYITFATEHGLTIKYVFLTHLHADFVAGHLELRDRVGATICLGAAAKAAYAFRPFRDGDTLEFGSVRLMVLETPGHTPESISIVVYDLDASDTEPHAVLTGDTLFIGDVGRPDLRAALGWSASRPWQHAFRFPAHEAARSAGHDVWFFRRMAQARFAEKRSARRRYPLLASSGV